MQIQLFFFSLEHVSFIRLITKITQSRQSSRRHFPDTKPTKVEMTLSGHKADKIRKPSGAKRPTHGETLDPQRARPRPTKGTTIKPNYTIRKRAKQTNLQIVSHFLFSSIESDIGSYLLCRFVRLFRSRLPSTVLLNL